MLLRVNFGTPSTVLVALILVASVLAVAPVVVAAAGEDEPNDTQETAMSITTGTTIDGELATSEDEDWFAFQADAGETVTVDVTVPSGVSDEPYFELRSPDGPIGGAAEDYGSAGETRTIGFTAERTGTYYLWVYLDPGSYSFSVDTTETDPFEPNERKEDAETVAFGQLTRGEITIGDEDWFRFDRNVTAGETILVNATLEEDAPGEPYFELRNADGPLGGAAENYGTPGETITIGKTVQRTGHHYLWAYLDRGAYSFTARTKTTDPFEPNERKETAETVAFDRLESGEITIGDEDWFAFDRNVTAGETILVNVTLDANATGQPYFELRNAEGPLGGAAENYGTPGETITIGKTVQRTGHHYLWAYLDRGAYSYTARTKTTDPFEPNENMEGAAPAYDDPFTPNEAVRSIGDEDWFAFRAEVGEEIRVTGTSETSEVFAEIVTPSGDESGTYLGSDGTNEATLTAESDGTYYLRVYLDTSEYRFNLTVGGEQMGLPNDRFEQPNPPSGNDDRANATALDAGVYTDLGMVDDDRDVFAIDLDAGERVIADAAFAHAENDLALELTDDGGSTVASADTATDGERLAFTAPENATYYLEVTGEAGAQSRYDLDLTTLRRVDVTVGPGSETLEPGATTTFDVAVSGVSSGLESANLTFESTDESVLTIQSVDAAGTGSVAANVSADGSTATANVTGLAPTADGTVTVATVTVASVGNGSATLAAGAEVTATGGYAYPVAGVQGTTVEVRTGPEPVAPGLAAPRDPDGDGRYEDVNGDGAATPGDATVLFNAVFDGNAAVTGNPGAYDFNDDGTVTPGDATVLFGEIFG